MTIFQLIMLGASAYFAFKIYEHIQTLQDPRDGMQEETGEDDRREVGRTKDAFSTFSSQDLMNKADEEFEKGDLQKALALLKEADTKEPNDPEILFKIAYILQQNNEGTSALNYYKNALEIDKDNEFIHNAMASIYRDKKEYISAKMHLISSLEIDPNNVVTYYNFGNLLVDMGHKDEAKEMYTKALMIDKDFKEAQEELDKLV